MTPDIKATFLLLLCLYNSIIAVCAIKELLVPVPKLNEEEERLAEELMRMC